MARYRTTVRPEPRVHGTSALLPAAVDGPPVAPARSAPAALRRRSRHLVLVPGGAGAPQRVLPFRSDVVSRPTHLLRRAPLDRASEPVAPREPGSAGAVLPVRPRTAVATPAIHGLPATVPILRLGLITLLLGVVLAMSGLLSDPAASGADAAARGTAVSAPVVAAGQTVVVAAGDNLWVIAQRAAPQENPHRVVEAIMAANGLTSAQLNPGQSLRIPALSVNG